MFVISQGGVVMLRLRSNNQNQICVSLLAWILVVVEGIYIYINANIQLITESMFPDREMEIHISTRQALPVFNQQLKSNFVYK